MRKFTSVEQIDTVISFERVLTPPAECGALAASVPVRAPRSLCSENLVRKRATGSVSFVWRRTLAASEAV